MELTGKIAVVFGGNGTIGSDLIENLLIHKIKKVYVVYHKRKQNILKIKKKYESRLSYSQVDVTNAKQVQKFIENIDKIDIGVNCVGITNDKLIGKISLRDWDSVIQTNLTSTFITSKILFSKMKSSGGGKIINISSIVGQVGAFGQINYSSSKGGIVSLTKTLALEGAQYGILANCVSPGYINSEMTKKIPDKVRNKIIKTIPLLKMGDPRDVTNVILFLASDLNQYITGEVFNVDGGL
jgi:3-oxoacyl-[acyl-carrier protein] reductase